MDEETGERCGAYVIYVFDATLVTKFGFFLNDDAEHNSNPTSFSIECRTLDLDSLLWTILRPQRHSNRF